MSANLYFSLGKDARETFACVSRELMRRDWLLPPHKGLFLSHPIPAMASKLGNSRSPHAQLCCCKWQKGSVRGSAKHGDCPESHQLLFVRTMLVHSRAHPWNQCWKQPAGAKPSCLWWIPCPKQLGVLFSLNDILNVLGFFHIQQGRLGRSELGYCQVSPIGISSSFQCIFQIAPEHRETLGWGSSRCCSWVLPPVAVFPQWR